MSATGRYLDSGVAQAYVRRSKRYARARDLARRVLLLVVVAAVGMFFLIPLVWMISTSVKPHDQVWLIPPAWIPREFRWDNFSEPWDAICRSRASISTP